MKTIGFLLSFFIGFIGFGQDTTEISPTTYKLAYGKAITIEHIKLEFKDLSADSRCPKGVMCVRAGEAIATLKLYKDNMFIKELELTFFPHGVVEELTQLLNKESILIRRLELLPYRSTANSEPKTSYYINLEANTTAN